MRARLPTIALFGWHGTGMTEDREAQGFLVRVEWFGVVLELGFGRVLP